MRLFRTPVRRKSRAELLDCWPADPASKITRRYFDYLPIGLFASVMGLTGLSVAWRLAADTYGLTNRVANLFAMLAVGCFIILASAYAAKALTAPDAVRAEYQHPVTGNLFGTIFISLLLLPIVLAPVLPLPAKAIWGIGAAGMLGFAWLMIDRWMSDRQQVGHATPAWIVPVVGLLDVPLALPLLQLPQLHGVMVACVAIGLFFAVPLFTMIFSRLLFEEPMADQLQPMLLILVAPFAVGFSAYVATAGLVDRFAEGLYGIMLFMLTVLVGRLRRIVQCCPFRVSWWAVSFPLAAAAAAAIRFAASRASIVPDMVAVALLTLATVVIVALSVRTILGIVRGELRALT